jgi:hypothetical protein
MTFIDINIDTLPQLQLSEVSRVYAFAKVAMTILIINVIFTSGLTAFQSLEGYIEQSKRV